MGYRGRHRAATRRMVTAARIAVGGVALAEITGGFSVPAAWAQDAPPAVVCDAQAQPVVQAADDQQPVDQRQAAPLHDHYIVQPGDNLTYIAAQYGVSWDALWALNSDKITNPDLIFAGQRLRLPA